MCPAPIEQTRMIYDTVAATYAELIEDTSFEAGLDLAMINDFLRQVGVGRGAQVLDAGCGAGRMITYLERLDPSVQVTGVDLSPAMVALARHSHPDRPIETGDLAALPCSDQQFDGVLAWYSIIHTPPAVLPDVVAEFHRVLRPGGSVLVGFHSGAGGERIAPRAYGHDVELRVQLHEVSRVVDTFAAAGFTPSVRLERVARAHERNSQGFVALTRT